MSRQKAAERLLDVLSEVHLMEPYVKLSPLAYRALRGAAAYVKACAGERLLSGVTEQGLISCIDQTGNTLKNEQRRMGHSNRAYSAWVERIYKTSMPLVQELYLEISKPTPSGTPKEHPPRPVES